MRVVFMGTPDFAAASLKALLAQGFDVVGVFTQPDKPQGRGMKLTYSPVKQLALEAGLPVFQPESFKDARALADFQALQPDVAAVVAYGRILPQAVLDTPPLGCINVHGSLLPLYRGAAPIQWTVLNGDAFGGVSTMYLAREMDTGDVIYSEKTPVGEFETSGELFDRLMVLGADLLCRTLRAVEAGTAPRTPQDHSRATYTRQLTKADSPIDWDRTPREIVKHICGLSPWPVATAELAGRSLKVYAAEYTDTRTDKAPGQVVCADKRGLEVACAGGETLYLTQLQAAGGKRMPASEYLRGHPIPVEA